MMPDMTKNSGESRCWRAIAVNAAAWVAGIIIFAMVGYYFYAPQFEGKSLGQGDIAPLLFLPKESAILEFVKNSMFCFLTNLELTFFSTE